MQEKVQTALPLDSEAVHEEELVEAEAEEETVSDDILAYKISCGGGMRGMSILKTNHFMTDKTNWMKICEFLREE